VHTGNRRADAVNNLLRRVAGWNLRSMPAVARPHCIFNARYLRIRKYSLRDIHVTYIWDPIESPLEA
jgi:hypothetical protein